MPVLDNGLLGSALAFTPLLVALTFGEPVMKLLARGARAVPRRLLPHYGNVMLDVVAPGTGAERRADAGAVLRAHRAAAQRAPHVHDADARARATRRDPVHPFSDAGMLAKEMPNARLLEADSLVELRMRPERLTKRDRGLPRRGLVGAPRARRPAPEQLPARSGAQAAGARLARALTGPSGASAGERPSRRAV